MSRFFDVAYEGHPTWDIGRPQPAVVRAAEEGLFDGSVLDVGCGTGQHARFLALQGHPVVGIDAATAAIDRALADRSSGVTYLVHDALDLGTLGRRFDSALDVGCFHTLQDEERFTYVNSVGGVLRPGGRLLLFCWSEQNQWGVGPRHLTQRELRRTFGPPWEIAAIVPEVLEGRQGLRAHAWRMDARLGSDLAPRAMGSGPTRAT
jgi:SAM-dependent methyltransferase